MIKIRQAIIVEGKYDKIHLSNIFDALIITTDGFRIFKDVEKRALIRLVAERTGIIVLTDSDSAGQMIRHCLEKFVPADKIKNVYLPRLAGKEKRKTAAAASGVLGVEGTPEKVIVEAFTRHGIIGEEKVLSGRPVTKTDFYLLGLSGGKNSQEKRNGLCKFLGFPPILTANSLLAVVNSLYRYEDFYKEVEKWNQEQVQN